MTAAARLELVALDAADIAELLVDAIATEHAEYPHHVAGALDEIARRRRTYEGLAGLEETRDLPEHIVTGAAAALDEVREAFVASLTVPLDYVISEKDARQLAVELSRQTARAAAASPSWAAVRATPSSRAFAPAWSTRAKRTLVPPMSQIRTGVGNVTGSPRPYQTELTRRHMRRQPSRAGMFPDA